MVEDLGPYNAILGRVWLHAMKAVPSTYHQMISYLTESGQVDLQGSQLAARQCYQLLLRERAQTDLSGEPPLTDQPPQYQLRSSVRPTSEDREPMAVDPLEIVPFDGSDRCVYISTLLSEEKKTQLCQVIQFNADVFAWTHADMPRISPVHASHKLNVTPSAKPVRQKVRHFHLDRHSIIQTEVENLLQNKFIIAVKYPEWLANVVVVPKKENKWRVCVDYTDLNDACPKDSFPLPHID